MLVAWCCSRCLKGHESNPDQVNELPDGWGLLPADSQGRRLAICAECIKGLNAIESNAAWRQARAFATTAGMMVVPRNTTFAFDWTEPALVRICNEDGAEGEAALLRAHWTGRYEVELETDLPTYMPGRSFCDVELECPYADYGRVVVPAPESGLATGPTLYVQMPGGQWYLGTVKGLYLPLQRQPTLPIEVVLTCRVEKPPATKTSGG
jgi:hypothetical protein